MAAASYKSDLANSSRDFIHIVWPAINPMIQGGEFVPVESNGHSNALAGLIDRYSGIDAFQLIQGRSLLRGLASRVQWIEPDKPPWRTFTIRLDRASGAETEFSKRLFAIRNNQGWLYPHLTIHSYIRDGELLDAAIVKTRDLYEFADTGLMELLQRNGGDYSSLMERVRFGERLYNSMVSLNCHKTQGDNAVFIAVSWSTLKKHHIKVKQAKKDVAIQPDLFTPVDRI